MPSTTGHCSDVVAVRLEMERIFGEPTVRAGVRTEEVERTLTVIGALTAPAGRARVAMTTAASAVENPLIMVGVQKSCIPLSVHWIFQSLANSHWQQPLFLLK